MGDLQQQKEQILALYETLAGIPRGKVCSYGDLGQRCGLSARHVGALLRNLPSDTDLPWHRVIAASGAILTPGMTQIDRLRSESIAVDVQGRRVRMGDYRW